MKRVSAFRTMDDVLHRTERDAQRWADRKYGEALRAVAGTIADSIGNGTTQRVSIAIDANLEALAMLPALKADTILDESPDD